MTNYTKPPVQPAWAEGGDRSDAPSNAEIQEGWPLSNTPPTRQRFNWLLNWITNAIRYWMQKGIADWDAAESYQAGGIIQDNTGQTWQAIRDNENAPPATSPLDWVKWPDTSAIEADVANAVATAGSAQTAAANAVTVAGTAQSTANAAMPKAGGTFTGPITLSADPSTNLQPASKQYVDKKDVGPFTMVKGLTANFPGTGTTSSITVGAARLRNVAGDTRYLSIAATFTLDLSAQGLNGRDQAANFNAQWVHVYYIYGNGQIGGVIGSANSVSPVLLANYTDYVYLFSVRVGSTNNVALACEIAASWVNYPPTLAPICGASTGVLVPPGSMVALSALFGAYVPPNAISWTAYLEHAASTTTGTLSKTTSIYKSSAGVELARTGMIQSGLTTPSTAVRWDQNTLNEIPYSPVPAIYVTIVDGTNGATTCYVQGYRVPNGAV